MYSLLATIEVAASVTAIGNSVDQVQFFNGSNLLGAAASVPFALTWSNIAAGDYTLTAVAFYNSGNNVASAPITIHVVDLPAPWQRMNIGQNAMPGTAALSN